MNARPTPLAVLAALLLWTLTAAPRAEVVAEHQVRIGDPATLTFWNRPIVTFHAEVDDIGTRDRVERAASKIDGALNATAGDKASAVPGTQANLSGYWIRIDGHQVFGLLPDDVDSTTGQTLDDLVAGTVAALQGALDARREHRHWPLILQGIALSLVATVAFGFALWGILRFHRRALRSQALLPGVQFKLGGVDLHPYVAVLELATIKLTSFGLGTVTAYLWLTFVFGRFPLTRPWAEGLAGYLTDLFGTLGTGALAAVPGFFTVLIIFLLTRVLVRAVNGFFGAVEHEALAVSWLAPDTAKASRRLTVVLIWIFALTVAYPYIPGSGSDAFKGIGVFVGLMVSLGSAGLINQVMSGLVVAYSRALKAGDYVRVGETEGTVSEVGMLSTKVITPKREAITVPNTVLVGAPITNYSRLAAGEGAMVGTTVTIGYDTPWRQVHAMLALAAERTPGVRKAPCPFVLQRSLSDYYPEYHLVVHLDRPEVRHRVLSDLHANIQDVFNEFGVQIMSPHFEAQPGDKVWVPQDQWHAAPAVPDGAETRA
jgi:small-conductance mechanosensitive channel